jgi:hypothetical protein
MPENDGNALQRLHAALAVMIQARLQEMRT